MEEIVKKVKTKKKVEITEEDQSLILEHMKRAPRTVNWTLSDIDNQLKDKTLIVNPQYQRNYIVSQAESSKYVESVFLGCAIPEVIFYENDSRSHTEILDGQQRVLSLIGFLNGEFALSALKEIPKLNGYTFKELPPSLSKKYRRYTLSVKTMEGSSADDNIFNNCKGYEFMAFERLNTGNKKLNPQEIRNGVYSGKLMEAAKKRAEEKTIKKYAEGIKNDNRFGITQFVIRLLANVDNFDEMKYGASNTINHFLNKTKDITDEEVSKYECKVKNCFSIINEYIGKEPFTYEETSTEKGKDNLLKHDIEPLFINIYRNFNEKQIKANAEDIKQGIRELIINPLYSDKNKYTDRSNTIKNKTKMMQDMIQAIVDNNPDNRKRYFSPDQKLQIFERDKDKITNNIICNICGNSVMNYDTAQVDHVIPFSQGGQTTIDNGQIVHSHCNLSKGNRVQQTN